MNIPSQYINEDIIFSFFLFILIDFPTAIDQFCFENKRHYTCVSLCDNDVNDEYVR